jgi:hypothetical protein
VSRDVIVVEDKHRLRGSQGKEWNKSQHTLRVANTWWLRVGGTRVGLDLLSQRCDGNGL